MKNKWKDRHITYIYSQKFFFIYIVQCSVSHERHEGDILLPSTPVSPLFSFSFSSVFFAFYTYKHILIQTLPMRHLKLSCNPYTVSLYIYIYIYVPQFEGRSISITPLTSPYTFHLHCVCIYIGIYLQYWNKLTFSILPSHFNCNFSSCTFSPDVSPKISSRSRVRKRQVQKIILLKDENN